MQYYKLHKNTLYYHAYYGVTLHDGGTCMYHMYTHIYTIHGTYIICIQYVTNKTDHRSQPILFIFFSIII